LIWELLERSPRQRSLAKEALDHALSVDRDFKCFRHCCGRGIQISAGRTRNVYFLPDCLSKARRHCALIDTSPVEP
jgi:hypothetical protein